MILAIAEEAPEITVHQINIYLLHRSYALEIEGYVESLESSRTVLVSLSVWDEICHTLSYDEISPIVFRSSASCENCKLLNQTIGILPQKYEPSVIEHRQLGEI